MNVLYWTWVFLSCRLVSSFGWKLQSVPCWSVSHFFPFLDACVYLDMQKAEKEKSFTSPTAKRPPSPSTVSSRHRSPSPGVSGPRRTPSPGAAKYETEIPARSSYSFFPFMLSWHTWWEPKCISSRQSPRYRQPSPSGVKQRPPSPQPASKPPPIQKPALTPTGPPVLRKSQSKPKDASPMTALTSQPQDTSTPSTKPKDGKNYLFIFIYFNQNMMRCCANQI